MRIFHENLLFMKFFIYENLMYGKESLRLLFFKKMLSKIATV